MVTFPIITQVNVQRLLVTNKEHGYLCVHYITCHDYIVYTLYPRDLFWVAVYNCVKQEVATVESEHPEESAYTLPITITVKHMFSTYIIVKFWINKMNKFISWLSSSHIPFFSQKIVQWLRPLQHRVAISHFCLLILHDMQLTLSRWFGLDLLSTRCRMQSILWYLCFGSHYLLTSHVLRTVRACIVSVLVLWLSFFFLFRSEVITMNVLC